MVRQSAALGGLVATALLATSQPAGAAPAPKPPAADLAGFNSSSTRCAASTTPRSPTWKRA
jgi:hypothetical protein